MRHTCFISYILQAELRLNTPYEAARNKVRNIWPGGHIQSNTHTCYDYGSKRKFHQDLTFRYTNFLLLRYEFAMFTEIEMFSYNPMACKE